MIVFDSDGNELFHWGEGLFKRPHGSCLSPDGHIWITDDHSHVVQKYTKDGKLLMTLGNKDRPSDSGYRVGGDREIFERIIQNITNKFPDVYAALFISPEGFPINTWGVSLERAEEISALLSALIGKTWEIVKGVKEGGELAFIQIQTNMGGIRIAPQDEFILVTLTKS